MARHEHTTPVRGDDLFYTLSQAWLCSWTGWLQHRTSATRTQIEAYIGMQREKKSKAETWTYWTHYEATREGREERRWGKRGIIDVEEARRRDRAKVVSAAITYRSSPLVQVRIWCLGITLWKKKKLLTKCSGKYEFMMETEHSEQNLPKRSGVVFL